MTKIRSRHSVGDLLCQYSEYLKGRKGKSRKQILVLKLLPHERKLLRMRMDQFDGMVRASEAIKIASINVVRRWALKEIKKSSKSNKGR